MVAESREEEPRAGEVLVRVAGCAVRPSDIDIFSGRELAQARLPLTLGNEISGSVVAAGAGVESWRGHDVVIPSVLPCGECVACTCGRPALCRRAVVPGRNVHGGFASHVRVPARGLCLVPFLDDRTSNPGRIDLATLALMSHTVATPYQAIARSGLVAGDVAVFVGLGVAGLVGLQIALARSAHVVALDSDPRRLELARGFGAKLTLLFDDVEGPTLAERIDTFATERDCPPWRVRIYETSGERVGRDLASRLLEAGRTLAIVGAREPGSSPALPDLATLDATIFGNSGCATEHYPALLRLVLSGRVVLTPFVEQRPMGSVQRGFRNLVGRSELRRVVLVPG